MSNIPFRDHLIIATQQRSVCVCCGLDPDYKKIPDQFKGSKSPENATFDFLSETINITHPFVAAYKIQKAFFDTYDGGSELLRAVILEIQKIAGNKFIFLDSKVGDTGNTMLAYMDYFFSKLNVDAALFNPYMGAEVWQNLEKYPFKAGIVLVRTSNPGSSTTQSIMMFDGRPLWEHILDLVNASWLQGMNTFPVLASTASDLNDSALEKLPLYMPVFIAGIGAQGGSYEIISRIKKLNSRPIFVGSSRQILYPLFSSGKSWQVAIRKAVINLITDLDCIK